MSQPLIYALVDPRDGRWRYVGKTVRSLKRRLSEHLHPFFLRAKTHKNSWLKSLLAVGLRPEIQVIEGVSLADLDAAERDWIAEAKRLGVDLTNGTDGGDGASGAVRSQETRRLLAAQKLGKRLSDEHRRAMELGRPGRPVTDGVRIWGSVGIAARDLNVDRALVRRVVQGKQKTAAGRELRYAELT